MGSDRNKYNDNVPNTRGLRVIPQRDHVTNALKDDLARYGVADHGGKVYIETSKGALVRVLNLDDTTSHVGGVRIRHLLIAITFYILGGVVAALLS